MGINPTPSVKIVVGTQIPTGSRTTPQVISVKGHRKCTSWIDTFVEETKNLYSPVIFRRWAGIMSIAAAIEHKVWLTTSSALPPNLYVFLMGHPGTGKTRTIREARRYLRELPEPHIAPVSLTFASLIDALQRHKRTIIRMPDAPLEYNSMVIAADELGSFMHKYDKEMADGLSALYDPDPYSQERRGRETKVKIQCPQINMLCGSSPSNIMDTLPESAWGQGFTRRVIMVFSDEQIIGDDFVEKDNSLSKDLIQDLKRISTIIGEYKVTEDYRNLVNLWRQDGEQLEGFPRPTHPRLAFYNASRKVNLYKLSMIAAIERSDVLTLTKDDFNRAMGWMLEAETFMPDVFKAGSANTDSNAMDDIYFFINSSDFGNGVPEQRIMNYARDKVPLQSLMSIMKAMEATGQIKRVEYDKKTNQHFWKANPRS